MSRFNACHPVALALYFASILLITMFSTNPVVLFLALVSGITFYIILENSRACVKKLPFYLLIFIVIALTNPLFSHNGVTILFFLNGNPVTLEAVLYGIDIAMMLLAVLFWFQCFNSIMTSDKLLFLFGRLSPKIALVLSSALRLIPLFQTQAKKIRQAQKAMGLFSSDSWLDKLRGNMRVFSSLITWALENAIDTGASMKGRGYGLKGRSYFALFRFTFADGIVIALILLFDFVVMAAMAVGNLSLTFYPKISGLKWGIDTISAVVAFGMLAFLPVIIEGREQILWNYYKSKI